MAQFTTRLTDMKMSLWRLGRCGVQCVYQRTVSFRFHSAQAAVKIVRPHIKVVFYRGAENCSKKIGWINNTAKMLQDGKFLIETFVSGLACISWPGYAKKMDGVITNALSYLSDVCWQQTRFATNLKFRIDFPKKKLAAKYWKINFIFASSQSDFRGDFFQLSRTGSGSQRGLLGGLFRNFPSNFFRHFFSIRFRYFTWKVCN